MNLNIIIIALLGITVILFFRASMFYGEMKYLYKEKLELKEIFAYKLCRITFAATIILIIINMVV